MFKVSAHRPLGAIDWYNLQGSLNLDPLYQRKSGLWNDEKQAGLIDSILNDYDIPKFYLADFRSIESPLNTDGSAYAVIDGKQRLLALFGFFDGKLRLSKRFILRENKSTLLAGADYLRLKTAAPSLAEKLESFILDVYSVVTDDPSRIEELFVRLNFGVAVNGAERRNAMPGPVPDVIRQLVLHPFFQKNIAFNTQRMAEYNVAAKLLLIEYRQDFADTKAANLDRFAQSVTDTELGALGAAFDRCRSVLDRMHQVFDEADPILASGGGIPVFYWLVRERGDQLQNVRSFLAEFLGQVRANLDLFRRSPDQADQELSAYYTMGRTTNDQGSLRGRYLILERRLRQYGGQS